MKRLPHALRQLASLPSRIARLEEQLSTIENQPIQSCIQVGSQDEREVRLFLTELEEAFRGTADTLKRQFQTDYSDYVLEAWDICGGGLCLDLGCGRGVWLEWMRDLGFPAQGVDLNPTVVAEAQFHGLHVAQGDLVSWLQAHPSSSAGVVSALHVLEHVPLFVCLSVFRESARLLKPGGLLIVETPNPENIWVSTHTFYNDPTHTQPLTPDSLSFMASHMGLEVIAIPRLHPYPEESRLSDDSPIAQRLNAMTCGGQDFALIARKPLAKPHPQAVSDSAACASS